MFNPGSEALKLKKGLSVAEFHPRFDIKVVVRDEEKENGRGMRMKETEMKMTEEMGEGNETNESLAGGHDPETAQSGSRKRNVAFNNYKRKGRGEIYANNKTGEGGAGGGPRLDTLPPPCCVVSPLDTVGSDGREKAYKNTNAEKLQGDTSMRTSNM